MLATVIVDDYSREETSMLAEALEEIASPRDNYGWSSSGIYCFWDPENKEILYIGLAIDIPLRFRQHNGLSACLEGASKRELIDQFFRHKKRLGYSVFVQSGLSQGVCNRWEKANSAALESIRVQYELENIEEALGLIDKDVNRQIRIYEGALIDAYKETMGKLPNWNKIGGCVGSGSEGEMAKYLLKSLTASHPKMDWFSSHVRIRELADRPLFMGYEEFLHGIRLLILMGNSPEKSREKLPDTMGYSISMQLEKYEERIVSL